MERIRSAAVATLLALALVAAACSGDDGGDGSSEVPATTVAPTTTTAAPGPAPTATRPAAVGINDMLGTQAAQDFAVHLGMWVVDESGGMRSVHDDILRTMGTQAGDEIAIAGGFTFAPIEGDTARIVAEDGGELPSLSVDLGLLRSTPDALAAVRDDLLAATESSGDTDFAAAIREDGAQVRPLLVEVVSADYRAARTHVRLGDRSEIDITSVDSVSPGDSILALYHFGQSIPGDPADEVGLNGMELFLDRWERGLIRVLGIEGAPVPFLDASVEARAGSTILSREQKASLAQGVSVAARFLPNELQNFVLQNRPGTLDVATGVSMGVDESRTDRYFIQVEVGSTSNRSIRVHYDSAAELFTAVRFSRAVEACARTADQLRLYNEAHRRPDRLTAVFDQFPTTRFLPEDNADGGDDDDVEPIASDEEFPPEPDEPEEPPLGCDLTGEELPFPPFPKGGMAYGDVRMTTIDGTFYSNNAAGEFLLYEDEAATVQMRLEPWASAFLGVSIATAAAIEVDGHTLSLHLDGSAWVDGEPADFERGEVRSLGSAEVTWWGDGWVVAAPDGTLIRVDDNLFSLVIRVDPSNDAAPTGLLGDADGDPDNDLVKRDGTLFDGDTVRDVDRLYGEYIESWRITDDESLFHYASGESTEGFTIDGFPSDPAVLEALSDEDRATGDDACAAAGVFMEGDLLNACIVDVAVTGEPALALDSLDAQVLAVERMLADATLEPDDVTAVTPGDTVLTIAGETLVFGVDPPNQRSVGIQASWSCEITDGDLIAEGSIDLADGPRYSITVWYRAPEPRLTLVLETPNEDGLTRNYAWVETLAPHFADAVDTMALEGQRFTASGELYVNDALERLAPGSELPDGATFDPFTLELDCSS